MSEIHATAAAGFDAAADVYAKARPGYPADAVEWMLGHLALAHEALVLDLAAGTGKLTAELVKRDVACIAVEPVEGMRAKLSEALPNISVLDGTAEAIPMPIHSVDAVVVAQAFHWFDAAKALAEIHRVLKPGARLALLWNLRDDRVDWVHRITQIIDPHAQGSGVGIPRHRDRAWQPVIEDSPLFEKVVEARFEHAQSMNADGLVGRMASTSFISVLTDTQKADVLGEIRELAATHPLLKGRPTFDFPYICEVGIYRATPS